MQVLLREEKAMCRHVILTASESLSRSQRMDICTDCVVEHSADVVRGG